MQTSSTEFDALFDFTGYEDGVRIIDTFYGADTVDANVTSAEPASAIDDVACVLDAASSSKHDDANEQQSIHSPALHHVSEAHKSSEDCHTFQGLRESAEVTTKEHGDSGGPCTKPASSAMASLAAVEDGTAARTERAVSPQVQVERIDHAKLLCKQEQSTSECKVVICHDGANSGELIVQSPLAKDAADFDCHDTAKKAENVDLPSHAEEHNQDISDLVKHATAGTTQPASTQASDAALESEPVTPSGNAVGPKSHYSRSTAKHKVNKRKAQQSLSSKSQVKKKSALQNELKNLQATLPRLSPRKTRAQRHSEPNAVAAARRRHSGL